MGLNCSWVLHFVFGFIIFQVILASFVPCLITCWYIMYQVFFELSIFVCLGLITSDGRFGIFCKWLDCAWIRLGLWVLVMDTAALYSCFDPDSQRRWSTDYWDDALLSTAVYWLQGTRRIKASIIHSFVLDLSFWNLSGFGVCIFTAGGHLFASIVGFGISVFRVIALSLRVTSWCLQCSKFGLIFPSFSIPPIPPKTQLLKSGSKIGRKCPYLRFFRIGFGFLEP